MEVYETDIVTKREIKSFEKWLDKNIGTDWEENQNDTNEFYLMIFDLTHKEVKEIRNYENSLGVKDV